MGGIFEVSRKKGREVRAWLEGDKRAGMPLLRSAARRDWIESKRGRGERIGGDSEIVALEVDQVPPSSSLQREQKHTGDGLPAALNAQTQ